MTVRYMEYDDVIGHIRWSSAIEALRAGHLRPHAEIADVFLGPSDATLLTRTAFIEGFGYGVKAVTVVRDNALRSLPTTQGAMSVFTPDSGALLAVIDSRLITEIKTVSDSLLGATLLANPRSKRLLIVGGGAIARSLVAAYPIIFPELQEVAVWTRRPEQAEQIVADHQDASAEVVAAHCLETAVAKADIVSSATMARTPIIEGRWVSKGTHVDLIGAFKADMREADDALMSSASVYVDSRDTTISHIGELKLPLASGALTSDAIRGDLYDLVPRGRSARVSDQEVTVFKNGGGAHLDLMIAMYLTEVVSSSK